MSSSSSCVLGYFCHFLSACGLSLDCFDSVVSASRKIRLRNDV